MNIKNFFQNLSVHKKFLILASTAVLFLIIALPLIIWAFGNPDSVYKTPITIIPTITPTPIPTPIPLEKYSYYFVPVTGFKELRNNINSTDLSNIELKVDENDFASIKDYFPQYKFKSINHDTFISEVANGSDIALASWQNLDPRLKVLSIDNQFFFDKTLDITKYPLQKSIEIKSNERDKYAVSFDPKKVNRILGTGEIIPARTVDRMMRTQNNYKYPFESVKPFLDKYDAQISTFEAAMLGTGNGSSCALGCMTFVGNERFIDGMKYSGVDVVSLADNHSMNAGLTGIANTIKVLNNTGIKTVGASEINNEEATKPAIIDVNGIKYGIIAYNDIPSVNDWATETKGGTARIDTNDYHIIPGRVAKDTKRAKDSGAQFIIAMMHWGAKEYTNEPLPHQKDLAHELVDNGVDLVLGDHPHWVGAVEFYTPKTGGNPKFIYYGIGNFIFDQDWSTETSQGSLLEMNFYENKLLSVKIYPHHIYQSQPRLVDENNKEYKQIFNRIWEYTGKI